MCVVAAREVVVQYLGWRHYKETLPLADFRARHDVHTARTGAWRAAKAGDQLQVFSACRRTWERGTVAAVAVDRVKLSIPSIPSVHGAYVSLAPSADHDDIRPVPRARRAGDSEARNPGGTAAAVAMGRRKIAEGRLAEAFDVFADLMADRCLPPDPALYGTLAALLENRQVG